MATRYIIERTNPNYTTERLHIKGDIIAWVAVYDYRQATLLTPAKAAQWMAHFSEILEMDPKSATRYILKVS